MAGTRDLSGINEPRIGVFGLANRADALPITAEFDTFKITPDDTAVPCTGDCFADQFGGAELNEDWSVVEPSGNLSVAGGAVEIPLEATDLYQASNTARDLVLTDLPDGPFVATTKVTAPIDRRFQQAGLVIYEDDDNYLKHVVQGRSSTPDVAANVVQTAKEVAARAVETNTPGLGASFPRTVWLRLTSEDGDQVLGSWSTDGETWTDMSGGYDLSGIDQPRIGVMAFANQAAGAGITASFDWFTLGDGPCGPGEEEPVDTTAPEVEAEVSGEATKTVTMTATDDSGAATIEYQVDDATTWTAYTEPLTFDEPGTYVVRYRATDAAGNRASGEVEVVVPEDEPVDTTAPEVGATVLGSYAGELVDEASSGATGEATMVSAADGDGYTTTVELSLEGLDPTQAYESHLHVGTTCGGFEGHYRDDPDGDGTPPNELWPTNPGWVPGSGDPRIKAEADGTSFAEATVAWAPRIEGGVLALHQDGAIIGCVDLDLTGAGTVVLDATDDVDVTSLTYTVDGGAETEYDGPFEITEPGEHVVAYTATDAAGNETTGEFEVVVPEEEPVDTTAPEVEAEVSGEATKTVTITATDDSGSATIEYQVDDATTWTAYTEPLTFDEPGTYVVRYRATDAAGNRASGEVEVVVPENEPDPEPGPKPTVSMTTAPAAANGRSNWFTSPVTVTLAGAGGEGKLSVEYRIDNGPWTAYTAPLRVTADGITRVQARATDEAGRSSAVGTTVIKMDATAPAVTIAGINDWAKLNLAAVRNARVTAADATSGVAQQVVRLNGTIVSSPARIDAMSLRTGRHELSVTVTDEAGNSASETITFRVVATTGGAKKLINRLVEDGTVGEKRGAKLKQELKAAKRADRSGSEREARQALKRFKKLASKVTDKEAKRALKHLSRTLKKQL